MDPSIAALVYMVVVLLVCGLFLWAITQFPLDATIRQLIRVIVIVVAALLCLRFLLMVFRVPVPF